ncbi:hypothetical protein [Fusobacterium ulcerans]|uniref:hypothetical protein n=1 Tax=Fusobacterium ulcerans TaxID=861 RepID=UPI0010322AB2|nr:hypothetical protein [Fusobacterium ulcerans]
MPKNECKFKEETSECQFKENTNECDIFNEYEKLKPLLKLGIAVEVFKYKWGKYTLMALFFSLGFIFVSGVISNLIDIKLFIDDNNRMFLHLKGVFEIFNLIQLWVGLGLGMVAMVFSIISMFLSFYNLELQKESEKNIKEKLDSMTKNVVKDVRDEVKENLNIIKKEMNEHFTKIEDTILEIKNRVPKLNIDISTEKPQETKGTKYLEEED